MRERNTTKKGIDDAKELANSYFELIKVRGIKKTASVFTKVSYNLLNTILLKMGISFFGFALALYLGSLLESYPLGFLIVGAIPFLAILLMRIFNRQTLQALLNFFTRIMTKDHE
ncbi:hypothetical protein CW751_12360 [Brumimicrobium salinarum]|uniref:Competence protein n=1 Tax=Brumimicrobium salinarum TaxID=2058658 RepID=A0A2I0R0U4_9FLAO|nr:hypothetical protein [Brumimicrobium salinarum]PKR80010.1 hypothetical protein CW751_12360 [Brumimicrobium salinarum]